MDRKPGPPYVGPQYPTMPTREILEIFDRYKTRHPDTPEWAIATEDQARAAMIDRCPVIPTAAFMECLMALMSAYGTEEVKS